MPQSLSKVLIHITFITKDRHPFLDTEIRPRLHAYLATVCRDFDCHAYRVGGVADHVHVAALLGRMVTQADLIEQIKKTSSRWVKKQGAEYEKFYWQRGYGAFSVGVKDLDALLKYIDNQEEHHKKETFQDEFRGFLRKYGIDYDRAVCLGLAVADPANYETRRWRWSVALRNTWGDASLCPRLV